MYFGTKTAKFCLRIISFSSLESELSFDSEGSEINFDRARSTTVNSLLRALRTIYIGYLELRLKTCDNVKSVIV